MTQSEAHDREPIAIVGIGCRLPGGADDPGALWRLLCEEFDAIGPIPADRFDVAALYDERPATPGRIMSKWGGFLTDIDGFDASFFEIAPREAERLDPQQRLLLETTWEAFEDAGVTRERFAGSNTGVFVGMWLNDFESRLFADPSALDLYMTTGSGRYSASGRLSFFFDLHGPSVSIDTACSSSLVAVHLACQSLRSGECDMAVAGGANVILQPHITIAYSQSRMMAPDGHCKFGDAAADGYVRSDGAAMVVLKRLSSALLEGDPIHAVVRGSAVTNDGRSSGFLATPGRGGQEEMLRHAYADANLDPRAVHYVEAHGTGTAAGDPVELGALGAVVGVGRLPDAPCLVGSLKTNVGHTEGAAGVAGLIKVALALEHGEIPASIHRQTPNPDIAWTELGLEVCARRRPWPTGNGLARAGVSSFGIAGTNAHVVLEVAPTRDEPTVHDDEAPFVLAISAQSPDALRDLASAYHATVSDDAAALADVCAGAALRRTHLDMRLAVVAGDREEMGAGLAAFARGETTFGAHVGQATTAPRVAFVFPGQGSQWPGMARELLAREPAFREAMARCDAAIRGEAGWSVMEQLAAHDADSRLDEIDVIQPTLFAIQVALAAQWRAYGVEPSAVVGHSMGEVAAAHVAGALSLHDAVAVICRRSHLLRRVAGRGAMAVVDLTLAEAEGAIAGHEDRLAVAVSNSPRSTVISGDPGAIDLVLADLESRQVFCRRVKVDVASHSPQMDPLLDDLRDRLDGLEPRPASVPIYSTVEGKVVEGDSLDAGYWVRNLRQPVLFGASVEQLAVDGHSAFVEVSPHPILLPAVEEVLRHGDHAGVAVPSLRRAEPERATLLTGLAALHVRGVRVEWAAIFPARRHVRLPTYPWQRERFWYEAAVPVARGGHPLLGQTLQPASAPGTTYWQTTLDGSDMAFLRDHVVAGTAMLPATGFVELALAAAATAGPGPYAITELELLEALPLADGRPVQLVLEPLGPGGQRFQIFSGDDDGAWRRHAGGRVAGSTGIATTARVSMEAVRARCTRHESGDVHDAAMRSRSLGYGPAFRTVQECWFGDDEVLGRLHLTTDRPGRSAARIALLDGCLQLAVAALPRPTASQTFLPVSAERVLVTDDIDADEELWGHAVVTATDDGEARFDVAMLDGSGRVLGDVRGLCLRRAGSGTAASDLLYELRWESSERVRGDAPSTTPGTWVVFAGASVGAGLADRLRAAGDRCVVVSAAATYARAGADEYQLDPSAHDDYARLLTDALGEQRSCRGIVYAWATAVGTDGAGAIRAAQELGAAAPLALVQALDTIDWAEPPRLWLVTRGAQSPDPASVVAAQAVIWGLGRVVATERPEWACTLVDVDPAAEAGDDRELFDEIDARAADSQVVLRADGRTVARLARRPSTVTAAVVSQDETDVYRIVAATPGTLDSIRPRMEARRPSRPGEVEVRVEAAGLNFLDVLKAMGIYPGIEASSEVALGAECAGTVVAVGSDVDELRVGDHVVAITSSYRDTPMLGSFVTLPAAFVTARPAHLSATEAAALPVAMVTAYYALHELGRLRRGERVLIHSATGGVGLAALQLCRRAGAEVLATAGSHEKREHLRSLGVEHVFDSRSVDFADEVLACTGGRGVDLVLNSLVGEAIPAGLAVLAPRGRFLELGKRDVYANSRIGLEAFKKNLSLFVIDLAGMTDDDPAYVAGLFREVMGLVAAGELAPLPTTPMPITEAADAFRTMAQARHIGKLVLTVPAGSVLADAPTVRADATYLITGGLGGLGLAVAGYLVGRGARCVALLGRSEPSAAAASAIAELEASGAQVLTVAADVADHDQLAAALALVRQSSPPLRGVVHAAGLLADATLTELDRDRLLAALAPKVEGAWNLHTLTQQDPLDFFVSFSSVAALFGLAGQANYAAGNAFLDALAHQRRGAGLPALCVDWGPWAEVGLAAAEANRGARLAEMGLGSVTPAEALEALDELLAAGDTQAAVLRLDAAAWAASDRTSGALLSLLLTDGREQSGPAGSATLRDALAEAVSGPRRRRLVEDAICAQLAPVLRTAPERVDRQRPLKAMGLDSLMALELRNRLESETGLTLSATIAFNYPTVTILAEYLAERMDVSLDASAPAATPSTPSGQLADLPHEEADSTDLSHDDLEALLSDELAAVDRLLKAD